MSMIRDRSLEVPTPCAADHGSVYHQCNPKEGISMGASSATLDFTNAEMKPNGKPLMDSQGRLPDRQGGRPVKVMTPKQIRARARRKQKIADEELRLLYKPIEEWDPEELARGRPRAKDGSFKGAVPKFIDRALHENIVRQFEKVVRTEMNTHTVKALTILEKILDDEDVDEKGRPVVAAGTKLDAAKFLIEHIIGKPKQRTETELSVKLQAMLGVAMVNPSMKQPGQYELTQGFIEADAWEDDDDVDDAG